MQYTLPSLRHLSLLPYESKLLHAKYKKANKLKLHQHIFIVFVKVTVHVTAWCVRNKNKKKHIKQVDLI